MVKIGCNEVAALRYFQIIKKIMILANDVSTMLVTIVSLVEFFKIQNNNLM